MQRPCPDERIVRTSAVCMVNEDVCPVSVPREEAREAKHCCREQEEAYATESGITDVAPKLWVTEQKSQLDYSIDFGGSRKHNKQNSPEVMAALKQNIGEQEDAAYYSVELEGEERLTNKWKEEEEDSALAFDCKVRQLHYAVIEKPEAADIPKKASEGCGKEGKRCIKKVEHRQIEEVAATMRFGIVVGVTGNSVEEVAGSVAIVNVVLHAAMQKLHQDNHEGHEETYHEEILRVVPECFEFSHLMYQFVRHDIKRTLFDFSIYLADIDAYDAETHCYHSAYEPH